jgi:ankyrin repeat protein
VDLSTEGGKIIKRLVDMGAAASVVVANSNDTLLHQCADEGYEDACLFLLDYYYYYYTTTKCSSGIGGTNNDVNAVNRKVRQSNLISFRHKDDGVVECIKKKKKKNNFLDQLFNPTVVNKYSRHPLE